MAASITLAGESLIAQKQSNGEALDVTHFVFANIPDLDTTEAVDRAAGLPPEDQVVFTQEVTRRGYLNPNEVVYSLMLGSDVGDFDFNYIGLTTLEGVLLIAAYVPRQQKRKETPPLQTGNNVTRNIVLKYDGAQVLTGISVPAQSWQFDYTMLFTAVNQRLDNIETELGKKLDLESWTPPALINLDGPSLVYPGSSNVYKITDYSIASIWSVATTTGTVTRSGDTVTLTIPSNAAAGIITLTITRDGIDVPFKIPLGSATIAKPSVKAPVAGATGVGFEPNISLSPYVVYPAGYDVHRKTRWQVALDAAFTQLVYNAESTFDLTTINLGSVGIRLDPSKQYFARAQMSGDILTSSWADGSSFNTASIYIRKPAITTPVDGQVEVSAGAAFTSDMFSVYGGADTHQASRWQCSTVADFSTILVDSGWITSPLTSYKPAATVPNKTTIYVRVKYRGAELGESEWSVIVRYVTSDQLKGTYTSLGSGSTGRFYLAGVAINGKIYVHGGIASPTPMAYGDVWEYDVAANAWQQKVTGQNLYAHSAVVHNGKMIIFGGAQDGYYSPNIRSYNPVTNVFSSIDPASGSPVPGGRFQHAAAIIDNKMYVCGGGNSSTSFIDLWAFDFTTLRWTQLAAPPAQVYGSAVAVNGKVYVFSGAAVYLYDPATNKWEVKKSGPRRDQTNGVLIDSKIYLYGGYDSVAMTYSSDLWFYDTVADTWQKLASGASARSGHVTVGVDGKLFIFAGHLNGSPKKDIWCIE